MSREESLFFTRNEQKPDRTYTPVFADEMSTKRTSTGNRLCGDNAGCHFDLAVTNDTELASNTLYHDKLVNETKEALSKYIVT